FTNQLECILPMIRLGSSGVAVNTTAYPTTCGTRLPSISRCRLMPDLAQSLIGAPRATAQRGRQQLSVSDLPLPINPVSLVVASDHVLEDGTDDSSLFAFLEAAMQRRARSVGLGAALHWEPVRRTYRMVLRTVQKGITGRPGVPSGFSGGNEN